jgi:predicted RNase H-like nuclease
VHTISSYGKANATAKRLTGKGLSKQSYGIMSKIAEVDSCLRSIHNSTGRIRESHPELCFRALNRSQPMSFNKKNKDGFQERLAVLMKHWPAAEKAIHLANIECRHLGAARDDIVDALCLAIVASLPPDILTSVPPDPPRDQHGLPMEIVYPAFSV